MWLSGDRKRRTVKYRESKQNVAESPKPSDAKCLVGTFNRTLGDVTLIIMFLSVSNRTYTNVSTASEHIEHIIHIRHLSTVAQK